MQETYTSTAASTAASLGQGPDIARASKSHTLSTEGRAVVRAKPQMRAEQAFKKRVSSQNRVRVIDSFTVSNLLSEIFYELPDPL